MRYVFLTLAILCGNANAQTNLSYAAFVARANALRPGETRDQIVAALGKPDEEHPSYIFYSLERYSASFPVGTQSYYAAEIHMKDGRMIGAINWAWMDTTGPAPGSH